MRKKLLFIITKSEMGGAQKFLYDFVTHLHPEKYDITIAAGGHGELLKKIRQNDIKTVKIKNFSNFFSIKNFLAFIEILNLIRKNKPDVIYLLSSEAGFSGSIAGSLYRLLRIKKIKIIYRIGGWAFKEPRNILLKKIYLWAEKLSAPFKDVIITNSEFDRQLGIKNHIAAPDKIKTIYNGLNIDELRFLPKEQAIKFIGLKIENLKLKIENSILIGTIANFYKNKGLDILISAIAKIKSKVSSSFLTPVFIIIGDGPERKNLEKLIKKHKTEDSVFLTGKIPDAYQYLKAFDLFVLPSIKEGQPWVILEAMAAEVPIIATNIAGIWEMIENEKTGLLTEPADSTALASAVEKMIARPSLAKNCAKNALESVQQKFNRDEMISKNEALFT